MGRKLVTAKENPDGYFFQVLMDDTKVNADGSPRLDHVRSWNWGKDKPASMTKPQYIRSCIEEIKRQCESKPEISGTTLPQEGTTL